MTTKDKRYETFTTPIGTALFAFLTSPRKYRNTGDPAYDAQLLLTGEAAEKFRDRIDQWMEESHEEHGGKQDPAPYILNPTDADNEPIPGAIAFKFKTKAFLKKRDGEVWDRKPVFFDKSGEIIAEPPILGNGSRIRLNFQVWKRPAYGSGGCGVQLQPTEVQLLELVPYSGGGQGFSAVSDDDDGQDAGQF